MFGYELIDARTLRTVADTIDKMASKAYGDGNNKEGDRLLDKVIMLREMANQQSTTTKKSS